MYKIKIVSYFSAAHSLRGYKGKCEALHGHNWRVEVMVSAKRLDSLGMVMDFSELKKITNQVLEELDHKHLNELEYFSAKGARLPDGQGSAAVGKNINPSSEEIACYIFQKLEGKITAKNCSLEEIRVWETEASCASYQK